MQAGVRARTQQTGFPIAPHEVIEWTEALVGYEIEPRTAQGDYLAALDAARAAVDATVPLAAFQDADTFLRAAANLPVSDVLQEGPPWGQLHEFATGSRLASSQDYNVKSWGDAQPFFEVLTTGTFSAESTSARAAATGPPGYVIDAAWEQRLKASAEKHSLTWLHHLHLAIADHHRGDAENARARYQASIALTPSVVAIRGLAVLACPIVCAAQGNNNCQFSDSVSCDSNSAAAFYREAWALINVAEQPPVPRAGPCPTVDPNPAATMARSLAAEASWHACAPLCLHRRCAAGVPYMIT